MTNIQTREQTPRVVAPGMRARPSPAAGRGGALTGREVMRIIRRRKWLILGCLGVMAVLSVGGTILWRRYLPFYSTRAYVGLNAPTYSMLTRPGYITADAIDRYKKSNAALVKTTTVLRKALRRDNMKKTRWYERLQRKDPELRLALIELEDEIGISLMPDTDILGIGMTVATSDRRDVEELATIVNEVAEAFVEQANMDVDRKRDLDYDAVEASHSQASTTLRTVRDSIREKLRVLSEPAIGKALDALTGREREVDKRIMDLRIEQTQAIAALETIEEQHDRGLLNTNPLILQALESDPTLRRLEDGLSNYRSLEGTLEGKYGAGHQQRKTLASRIQGMENEVEARRNKLIESNVEALRVNFRLQERTITKQLVEMTEHRDAIRQERKDLADAQTEIETLRAEEEEIQRGMELLEDRLRDLRVLKRDKPAYMRHYADIPLEPSWPSLKVMVPVGCLVGLALGLGLAFLLELMDTSVKTPTDITQRVDLPLLAMVPHGDEMETEVDDFRTVCLSGPDPLVGEAFRQLRTNLLFSGPAERRRCLLVTSPSPDDGRTTVAVNLAAAVASSGRRVLLMDANFRRPTVESLFEEAGEAGLSDVLSGQKPWEPCVVETKVENLSVMPSGKLPPNPNELLGGDLARTVMAQLAERYDQIIVDGPPLLISDASVLAAQADGVILVVRAGVNTHGIVTRCRNSLSRVGAHVLGVVLNGVRSTVGGYLQKNYDAFHDYNDQDLE